eukprot:scaffold3310_cov87-Skeletonema_menzelii.AAC.4
MSCCGCNCTQLNSSQQLAWLVWSLPRAHYEDVTSKTFNEKLSHSTDREGMPEYLFLRKDPTIPTYGDAGRPLKGGKRGDNPLFLQLLWLSTSTCDVKVPLSRELFEGSGMCLPIT